MFAPLLAPSRCISAHLLQCFRAMSQEGGVACMIPTTGQLAAARARGEPLTADVEWRTRELFTAASSGHVCRASKSIEKQCLAGHGRGVHLNQQDGACS